MLDRFIDWMIGALLFFNGVMVVNGDDVLVNVFSLVVVVGCAATLTARYSVRTIKRAAADVEALMPEDIQFALVGEQLTALVTRGSGEPVLLTIPPEVSAGGPGSVVPWILEQLLA